MKAKVSGVPYEVELPNETLQLGLVLNAIDKMRLTNTEDVSIEFLSGFNYALDCVKKQLTNSENLIWTK